MEQEEAHVPVRTRELYTSENGDRWSLARDSDSGRIFIRHEANAPSGGNVSDVEIGAFFAKGGSGPEKQELLRLIGALVDDADEPANGSPAI